MEKKIIQGSTWPGEIKDVKISFSDEQLKEYLPAWQEVFKGEKRGLALMCFIMADKEGFYKKSRSYRNNNPGNIGNTDSGANRKCATLQEGIELQKDYIIRVAAGQNKNYPLGKDLFIEPRYSEEIANNPKTYAGMSPWIPGYKFKYTGKLEQFVKIYSTGARQGNTYLSTIISYFKNQGYDIGPQTTISEIINLE